MLLRVALLLLSLWISAVLWQQTITELKPGNKTQLVEERQGQVDRAVTFITFRKSKLAASGLLTLVNQFEDFLAKRGMITEAYYKISDDTVAVCTTQLSDMMELKTIATKETPVYYIESGGEIKLGAMITPEEREEYFTQLKAEMRKGYKPKKKSKKKKAKKADPNDEYEKPIQEDL